ncbi:hypothetical protein [Emticicia sp. 21SJ11W-3]|uniref:DUF922 domain-containing protein n=1 Tax=Emticicia sp. 21SJ11W-3 TaxID=2916755 RepID=UPI00209E652B|nr:hypothetical protein [Emticicia sp. 21SJ11W-3]UTA69179.1 hypothetical protein MB380_05100 [Emticicia sp. 21SJ11W-3]
MRRIIDTLMIFYCCCVAQTAIAQYVITLKDTQIDVKPIDYYIADVKDGRVQKNGLGTIITPADTKAGITIAGGVKNGLQRFISGNLPKNTATTPVLYNLTQLNVHETRNAQGGINGKMTMSVSYERIGRNDTIKLVDSQVYLDYKRSGGAPNMNNYESVLRRLVLQTLQYFTDWLKLNKGKHEALARGIEIKLMPDYKLNDKDTIYYETKKVTWDDFRGSPSGLNRYGAAIFSNFGYVSSFNVSGGIIRANIQTKTYMVRGMSWVNESARTAYALAHEQLHFDITKLVVERFKKKVSALQAESIDDLNSMIQFEYLESYREMNSLQRAYDDETSHSQDTFKQAEWAEKIKTWLNELAG